MKTVMQSIRMLLVLTFVTGLIYPVIITGLSQLFFPHKANGSLLSRGDNQVGSELIGQTFSSDVYFWSRPSAIGYNPLPSSGTNLGPTSSVLRDSVVARAGHLGVSVETAPAVLLFASGSGLDPHISPEAATFQVDRVLAARGFTESKRTELTNLIKSHTEERQFGLFGEPRVNVLLLNFALDSLMSHQ
jgi:K+-transporting ATPase ATPase C chain